MTELAHQQPQFIGDVDGVDALDAHGLAQRAHGSGIAVTGGPQQLGRPPTQFKQVMRGVHDLNHPFRSPPKTPIPRHFSHTRQMRNMLHHNISRTAAIGTDPDIFRPPTKKPLTEV